MPPIPSRPVPRDRRRASAAATLLAAFALMGCSATTLDSADRALRLAVTDVTSAAAALAPALFAEPAAPRTRPLDTPLAPLARPRRVLDGPIVARDGLTGASLTLAPQTLRGGAVRVRQSDGCVWERTDWFAPARRWRDCGDSRHWKSGTARIAGGEGLWPLREGATARWSRQAVSDTGRDYRRETVCRVTDSVAVLRDGRAPTPAFVVDCTDGKRVRTTWYAPGEGPVAFRKTHQDKGVEEAWVRR
jgi:hypothetical protein